MIKLSHREMIHKIENEETFHAVASDYSFSLKIDDYVPYACAAIHNGHHFRKNLWDKVIHTEYERWYEEDPCTGEMISGLPITVIANDSRFEYDLNRHPDNAVYDNAWGKSLWRTQLSGNEVSESLEKHENFYRVVLTLVLKLEEMFGSSVVYDLHSYNFRRWDRTVPVFNLGTSNIDQVTYATAIHQWQQILTNMELPIRPKVTCTINDVFQGNGYFLKYITANSKNTLVLATEISKVYCDERDGRIFPEVVTTIKDLFKYHIKAHAHRFYDRHHDID
ncbi:MAG: N-formylglutamate amidohydrolase [Nonlabens sp.]